MTPPKILKCWPGITPEGDGIHINFEFSDGTARAAIITSEQAKKLAQHINDLFENHAAHKATWQAAKGPHGAN